MNIVRSHQKCQVSTFNGGCEKSHMAFLSLKTTLWNQKVGKPQVIMFQCLILLYFILAKQKDLLLLLGDFN